MLYFNLIANWQIFFWTSTYFIIYCTYHRNCYNKTDFQPLYKTKTKNHTDIQIDKQTHKETEPLRTQTSQLLKRISVIGMIKPNLNSSCSRWRSCFAAASIRHKATLKESWSDYIPSFSLTECIVVVWVRKTGGVCLSDWSKSCWFFYTLLKMAHSLSSA